MKIFICIFALVAVSYALPRPNGKIVGGTDAVTGQFPWQVSLRRPTAVNSHFCGGSIISASWVMCACHCKTTTGNVVVKAGGVQLASLPVEESGVFTCNSDYDSNAISSDFSVIHLNSPITINTANVDSIPLAPSNTVFESGNAVTSGWGYTINSPQPAVIASTLQTATVPLLTQAECNDIWSPLGLTQRIDDTMQCAGAAGATSCMGDSGGPLVAMYGGQWTLIGAVSWGSSSCSTDSPGVYSKISYARTWINDITGI